MISVRKHTAHVVASDAQSMATAIDAALLQQVRLCASVIEASGEAKLAMTTTQRLLSTMSTGFLKLVEGRAEITASVRELQVIQSRSNLRETSFGCPGGPVTFMSANSTTVDSVEQQA